MTASTALEENFNRKLEVVTAGLPKEYLGIKKDSKRRCHDSNGLHGITKC
jgi:uncharacterized protein (DUF2141 family)